VKKVPPYRVPATPLISSSAWTGDVPAARLSEISVDVKEGMAVPAALTRIRVLVDVRELWTANRCFPYHLVRGIVHSANLDPSPESMSLEAGSGHPRRYVSNYIKGVLSEDAHDFQKCRQRNIRAGKKSTRTEPGLPPVTVSIPASSANRTYSSSLERTVWPYVIFIIVPAANLFLGSNVDYLQMEYRGYSTCGCAGRRHQAFQGGHAIGYKPRHAEWIEKS
jgi:hypothetical protein